MDPANARPKDPGTWNRYSYVGGDPINRKDPTGKCYYDGYTWWDGDPENTYYDPDTYYYGDCDTGEGDASGPDPCYYASTDGCGGSSGDGGDGGDPVSTAGQANGDITIKNFTQKGRQFNRVTSVLGDIQNEILGTDNPCSQWLNSGTSSASDAIALLLQNGSYGVGTVVNNPTVAAFVGTNNADGVATGIPGGTNFTVNTDGAFFSAGQKISGNGVSYGGGSLQAQTFILIHELAHLLELPNFNPGDAGSAVAEAANNNLVQINCGQQVAGVH